MNSLIYDWKEMVTIWIRHFRHNRKRWLMAYVGCLCVLITGSYLYMRYQFACKLSDSIAEFNNDIIGYSLEHSVTRAYDNVLNSVYLGEDQIISFAFCFTDTNTVIRTGNRIYLTDGTNTYLYQPDDQEQYADACKKISAVLTGNMVGYAHTHLLIDEFNRICGIRFVDYEGKPYAQKTWLESKTAEWIQAELQFPGMSSGIKYWKKWLNDTYLQEALETFTGEEEPTIDYVYHPGTGTYTILTYHDDEPAVFVFTRINKAFYSARNIQYFRITIPAEDGLSGLGMAMVASSSHPLRAAVKFCMNLHVLGLFILLLSWVLKDALNEKRSEREQIRELRRDTMNALAHELRTPLSAIMGYAENIQYHVNDDRNDYYLSQIRDKGNQMNEMIDRMLALSKLEETSITLIREELNIRKIIENCIQSYPDNEFGIESSDDMIIVADPTYIEKMIKCLIDNAVQHGDTCTPVTIRIDQSSCEIHNKAQSLSQEKMKNLFTFHLSEDDKFHYGLYFAKKAAQKNGLELMVFNDGDGITALISK